jgi:hypothetical protein
LQKPPQRAFESKALDKELKKVPESLSSLIAGQQRRKAPLFNNKQPISVGV